MTRALGDVRYKWPWNTVRFHYDRGNIAIAQPIVMDDFITARPHLISQPLEPNKLHLAILASDGLWDSKGFEDDLAVIERVSELWETSPRPYVSAQDICETLCKEAVARWVGKADNVSVVIALIGP
ncbi:hypothetical protein HK102_010014 [Quaeritorhiza haematococci]|nr:hypothetical protein HK102_010014 [Quaeritorhiza haematococci]